jgi:hypothetical protein
MSLLGSLFGTPNKEQFARIVLDALQALGDTGSYDAGAFKITVSGEETRVLFLANGYHDYCAAPGDKRRGVVQRLADLLRIPALAGVSWDEARPSILPVVRERSYHECARLQLHVLGLEGAADVPPTRAVAPHLLASIGRDTPEQTHHVAERDLKAWGVSFDEALRVAVANLRQRGARELTLVQPGVYRSPWHDTYVASRLALIDLFSKLEIQGDPVALTPTRSLLLVTGAGDDERLCQVAAMAEAALVHDRPTTGIAVRLVDGRWAPFLPPEGHPAHWPLKRVALTSLASEYQAQKALLDQLYAAAGKEVLVASFQTRVHPDGPCASFGTWTSAAREVLLPWCDDIVFVRSEKGKEPSVVASAPWRQVQQIVGSLIQPTDMYPTRFRVHGFPTEGQLHAIGMHNALLVQP